MSPWIDGIMHELSVCKRDSTIDRAVFLRPTLVSEKSFCGTKLAGRFQEVWSR